MYKAYYQLKEVPFRRDVSAGAICMHSQFEEAAGRLLYTARGHGFALVTGPCGTGKTTLLRCVCSRLAQDRYKVIYISDSSLTPGGFYRAALQNLGAATHRSAGDNKREFASVLRNMPGTCGMQPVFILDESHLFTLPMLEEVRFILNAELDSQSPAGLILCGQDELLDKLRLVQLTAVRQRIDLICSLRPLTKSEAHSYVEHRLTSAGAQQPIFTEAALNVLYDFAGGVPRVLDKACTTLLIYGCQQHKPMLDEQDAALVVQNEFLT